MTMMRLSLSADRRTGPAASAPAPAAGLRAAAAGAPVRAAGLRAAAAGALALALAGCVGGGMAPPRPVGTAEAPPAAPVQAPAGDVIGTGSVKVALILPLSGAGTGAVAARAMRNAAELSLAEFQNPDLTILVKDDRGTPEGAQAAAQAAVQEGAELIIGPLFAGTVQAAGTVARQAGRPMLAFSSDAGVAARGVYLLSFLPGAEVERVVEHAAQSGRRSIAALVPETTYGSVVEAQFREAAAQRGLRVAAIERYPAGQPQGAVERLRPIIAGAAPQADALLIPENGDGIAAVGEALQAAGFNPARVKPLGTGVWNEPRVFAVPALQGGWFAAPDNRGYNAFAGRYRARFGGDPTRIATLSYDAVSLAAALARTQGSQRFSEEVLTNPSGFAGADGVFRFRTDGTNDRSLAVQEIRSGGPVLVSPAPRALPGT
jgi:ABC-type branched-subunit amino acid transport system substrate-binding protein